MQVIDCKIVQNYIRFIFDTDGVMYYGRGVLPGTDVETYRFVHSYGFFNRDEYKQAKKIANKYVKQKGYDSLYNFLKEIK